MSIRPVDFGGMIQRTDDVGVLKHQEDSKAALDQSNVQAHLLKQEDEKAHQVQDPDNAQKLQNQLDAKDEGRGQYQQNHGNQKKKKEDQDVKVIRKNASGSFDIKI